MPRDWSNLAAASRGEHLEVDFKEAFYQLITAQILYESEKSQCTAYRLIDKYEDAFEEAAALAGLELRIDRAFRYCAVIPTLESQTTLTINDSYLLIVLRKAHHERTQRGESEGGCVSVDIDELQELFKLETGGRELPKRRFELNDIFRRMKRFGIAKTEDLDDDSEQPFNVTILPGIMTVVDEVLLSRLASYQALAAAEEARQCLGDDLAEAVASQNASEA